MNRWIKLTLIGGLLLDRTCMTSGKKKMCRELGCYSEELRARERSCSERKRGNGLPGRGSPP